MNVTRFEDYDQQAYATAIYPGRGYNLIYPALKLAGEAGEVAEKVGKLIRDKGYRPSFSDYPTAITGNQIAEADRKDLLKELGDVLWYISALAGELDSNLQEVAEMNLDKLADRANRNKLGGSGDNR